MGQRISIHIGVDYPYAIRNVRKDTDFFPSLLGLANYYLMASQNQMDKYFLVNESATLENVGELMGKVIDSKENIDLLFLTYCGHTFTLDTPSSYSLNTQFYEIDISANGQSYQSKPVEVNNQKEDYWVLFNGVLFDQVLLTFLSELSNKTTVVIVNETCHSSIDRAPSTDFLAADPARNSFLFWAKQMKLSKSINVNSNVLFYASSDDTHQTLGQIPHSFVSLYNDVFRSEWDERKRRPTYINLQHKINSEDTAKQGAKLVVSQALPPQILNQSFLT